MRFVVINPRGPGRDGIRPAANPPLLTAGQRGEKQEVLLLFTALVTAALRFTTVLLDHRHTAVIVVQRQSVENK